VICINSLLACACLVDMYRFRSDAQILSNTRHERNYVVQKTPHLVYGVVFLQIVAPALTVIYLM
jgi:hypothetical protein